MIFPSSSGNPGGSSSCRTPYRKQITASEHLHISYYRKVCLDFTVRKNEDEVRVSDDHIMGFSNPRRRLVLHWEESRSKEEDDLVMIGHMPFAELIYGKIVSTKAILDKTTNKCKGYGFVDFDSPAAAQKAVSALKASGVQAQMAKLILPQQCKAPTEPLLCKFADGGQKKRQNPNKYIPNGRPWHREGEAGMTLTYDPTTAAIQNGFYPSPYSIATNRMITQTSITPYIASPVSAYQVAKETRENKYRGSAIKVQSPSWMQPQPYILQHPGAVLTPSMEHTMSLQPASMISPLAQQMSHLSLGSTGTYMPATSAVQGAYLPQYTHVQTPAVPVEEASGQQQVAVETSNDHSPYTFQPNKCTEGCA
ncbi:hypothetical protein EI555_004870 [Monodon monoceros]|uniref:RRM domain-containing protein n=1 Tax=Monodon monoceros TaxID=40151 RepID=A0A4U1FH62_MONMO|nr:hypothetical protein EI555_004870 [Monodon monoceros]